MIKKSLHIFTLIFTILFTILSCTKNVVNDATTTDIATTLTLEFSKSSGGVYDDQPVVIIAEIKNYNPINPLYGSVNFTVDGNDVCKDVPIRNENNKILASCEVKLGVGDHTISAVYSGGGGYAMSYTSLPYQIQFIGTYLTMNAPNINSQTATFTTYLNTTVPRLNTQIPKGRIIFKLDDEQKCDVPLSSGAKDSLLAICDMTVTTGEHKTSVKYLHADGDIYSDSPEISYLFNIGQFNTSLTANIPQGENEVGDGYRKTFKITFIHEGAKSIDPVPTGDVKLFFKGPDQQGQNIEAICTKLERSNTGPQYSTSECTVDLSNSKAGTYTVTGQYNSSQNDPYSTSHLPETTYHLIKNKTSVTLDVNFKKILLGSPITFIPTVKRGQTIVSTGTVNIMFNQSHICTMNLKTPEDSSCNNYIPYTPGRESTTTLSFSAQYNGDDSIGANDTSTTSEPTVVYAQISCENPKVSPIEYANCSATEGCILSFNCDSEGDPTPIDSNIIQKFFTLKTEPPDTYLLIRTIRIDPQTVGLVPPDSFVNPEWYNKTIFCAIDGTKVGCKHFMPIADNVTIKSSILYRFNKPGEDSDTKAQSNITDLTVNITNQKPLSETTTECGRFGFKSDFTEPKTDTYDNPEIYSTVQRIYDCSKRIKNSSGRGDGYGNLLDNTPIDDKWFLVSCFDKDREHCSWLTPVVQSTKPTGPGEYLSKRDDKGQKIATSSLVGSRFLISGLLINNDKKNFTGNFFQTNGKNPLGGCTDDWRKGSYDIYPVHNLGHGQAEYVDIDILHADPFCAYGPQPAGNIGCTSSCYLDRFSLPEDLAAYRLSDNISDNICVLTSKNSDETYQFLSGITNTKYDWQLPSYPILLLLSGGGQMGNPGHCEPYFDPSTPYDGRFWPYYWKANMYCLRTLRNKDDSPPGFRALDPIPGFSSPFWSSSVNGRYLLDDAKDNAGTILINKMSIFGWLYSGSHWGAGLAWPDLTRKSSIGDTPIGARCISTKW